MIGIVKDLYKFDLLNKGSNITEYPKGGNRAAKKNTERFLPYPGVWMRLKTIGRKLV